MDWSRFSHLSFSDLSGLVSRRTVILVLMAVILYQATGIFYKVLTLQLVRMRPAPAAVGKAQTAAIARSRTGGCLPDHLREEPLRYDDQGGHGKTGRRHAGSTGCRAPHRSPGDRCGRAQVRVCGYRGEGDEETAAREGGGSRCRGEGDPDQAQRHRSSRQRSGADPQDGGDERGADRTAATGSAARRRPPPAAPRGTTVISRSEIDAGLQDMGSLLRQAQVRPYFEAGVPDGFHDQQHQAGEPLPEDGGRRRGYHPGGERPEDPDGG